MCHSVIFGSLFLSNANNMILGSNGIFQKIELDMSFSSFSQQLKKSEKLDQNDRIAIAGNCSNLAAGNCYSHFPILNLKRVELSYS